jgi:hypothetical protein
MEDKDKDNLELPEKDSVKPITMTEKFELYCSENPDALECRIYED